MTDRKVSDGLRAVADLLDEMIDAGISPDARVCITPTRENLHRILEILKLPQNLNPRDGDPWSRVGGEGMVQGVEVQVWGWLKELGEKKMVTKEVEVWELGGLDMGVVKS